MPYNVNIQSSSPYRGSAGNTLTCKLCNLEISAWNESDKLCLENTYFLSIDYDGIHRSYGEVHTENSYIAWFPLLVVRSYKGFADKILISWKMKFLNKEEKVTIKNGHAGEREHLQGLLRFQHVVKGSQTHNNKISVLSWKNSNGFYRNIRQKHWSCPKE